MSVRFSYPTAAAPTTELVFGNIEQLPSARPVRRLQSAFDTDAGAQVIYDWGAAQRTFTIDAWPLTGVQAAALEAFYLDTANGRANTWEFTDAGGVVYLVRFSQDLMALERQAFDLYRVNLTLRVVT